MNTNFFDLKRRNKRDILYELLTEQSEGIISSKELNAINRLVDDNSKASAATKKQVKKSTKKTARKRKKGTKRKTTHYLTEDVFKELDSVTKDLQSLVPKNLQRKISKTQIVNRAISLILEEFAAKGEKSRIAKHLVPKI